MQPLDILYADADLLAVNKPAGVLVHRSSIDRAERDSVRDRLRVELGGPLHLLHRLDRPVAGVLLFALHAEAARRMTAAFAQGSVIKTYLAIVRGHAPQRGVIDYPLREMRDEVSDARARSGKSPQPAVTAYERLRTVELPTSRQAWLETQLPRTTQRSTYDNGPDTHSPRRARRKRDCKDTKKDSLRLGVSFVEPSCPSW